VREIKSTCSTASRAVASALPRTTASTTILAPKPLYHAPESFQNLTFAIRDLKEEEEEERSLIVDLKRHTQLKMQALLGGT